MFLQRVLEINVRQKQCLNHRDGMSFQECLKYNMKMGFVTLWFFDHCTLKTFDWPISLMGKISNTLVVN